MAENVFTPEFYKGLYDYLIKDMDGNHLFFEEAIKGEFIGMDCDSVGGVYVTLEVQFDNEEESSAPFDAPWDERYYRVITDIVDIKNVKVYESSNRDAKEIEGFDYDAFFAATA